MEVSHKEIDSRKRKKMMEIKKKINNLTKEQLKAAIEKKKLCNAKAMTVVERLIEPNIQKIWLLESLVHINQSHYQDAVEERAITKSCGYPLCDKSLEDVPKKQFHISTKENKVYDITDRKNYCSNVCYKASIYLKEQLYTSPLWLRDCEDIIEYKLFSPVNKFGSTGIEIDLGNVSPVKTEEVNDFERKGQEISQSEIDSFPGLENSMETNSQVVDDNDTDLKVKKQKISNNKEGENHPDESTSEQEKEIGNHKKNETQIRNKIRPKCKNRIQSTGDKIILFLDSWLTIDSLRFLYGDDRLKEIFDEFGTPAERFGELINTKDAFMYERYAEICKRLNFVELKEKVEHNEVIPRKPIPDFETLKMETKELEIKVRNFYSGDKMVSFQNASNETKANDNDIKNNLPPILPLIDNHCLLATRRRIVLEKLYKTLPDIQSALGLFHFNIRHEIQEFVHTLALTPTNITLSPSEWNLASIVIIKLFTLRNELLEYAFKSELTQKRIINLLLSYRLDIDYLQNCITKLSNVEQIIKNSQ